MRNIDPLRLILAIFLPPIGALLQVGLSFHFYVNVVLTLFGIIPGVIHALWLVLQNRAT